jgi:hypothetical protein
LKKFLGNHIQARQANATVVMVKQHTQTCSQAWVCNSLPGETMLAETGERKRKNNVVQCRGGIDFIKTERGELLIQL